MIELGSSLSGWRMVRWLFFSFGSSSWDCGWEVVDRDGGS